ncbi:hypothetical protein BGW80DRAFT_1324086, partial [Lactifluus volemus]
SPASSRPPTPACSRDKSGTQANTLHTKQQNKPSVVQSTTSSNLQTVHPPPVTKPSSHNATPSATCFNPTYLGAGSLS